MANPGDFAYTVKQQADIVRIVGDYIKLKKAGAQNYSGLCPFHGEKTPHSPFTPPSQFYHCFGCGVSGDVFSFVQKIENITFPEAVRAVAQKLGIAAAESQLQQSSRSARKPNSAPSCSKSTSAPAHFSRNACAVPKAPTPANISPDAASTKRPSNLFASAMRPTPAFCCAIA